MTSKRKKADTTDGPRKLSFEKSLERLEKIVEEMESGSLGLEKLMKHFEEGQSLVADCSKKLNEVERKIEKLVTRDGQPATEPFETQDEAEEDEDLF